MKTVAFWANELSERGVPIALFDYAYYNQTILKNQSIILFDRTMPRDPNAPRNDSAVITKFANHFRVYGLLSFQFVDRLFTEIHCDVLYIIKSGGWDGKISESVRTVVHCVFEMPHPHGSVYASISPWVRGNDGNYPVVPHMISLPEHTRDLREALNIPSSATVFGRYGGYAQFDIPFVHNVVFYVASHYPEIYFLFMNTAPFCPALPNVIHVEKTAVLDQKVEFINTCDAMIWGRNDGETFGLSIGEFSSKNKPVFAMDTGGDCAHVHILGEKGIWYTRETLVSLLVNFDKTTAQTQDWNAFREYTPEKVMQIFDDVFLRSPTEESPND